MAQKAGKALVVGAGISGIRTALDLAETGYGVTLIDKAPHIGGILSQLDRQFPTNHCGMCKMLPLIERDQSSQFCLRKGLFHENIDILLNTQVAAVDGEPGKFSVTLNAKPTWVDPGKCMGCGACTDVCPVVVPDEFNQGLSTRKAIYLPVPHNIPNTYVIDSAACNNCRECEKACPAGAIQLAFEKRKSFAILVVDDELIVRDSLKEWLDEEGFSVETAASGPDALEKLAQTPFNLMLTDIKMPGMDGVTVLTKALETHPDLCVLMMTAYATVETAVEAMKIGARDYLMKPFDPEDMLTKVVDLYEELETGNLSTIDVGSLVFCGGTEYYNPASGINTYGYGDVPHVVTNLELERIFSGTGPSQGLLTRPLDGKPIKKIAWLQCVGSRDLQCNADFCSSVCCMIAIKEALLAKELGGAHVETTLFYMDMRALGKSFQRYRDTAESEHLVKFERARVHTVWRDALTGDPNIRFVRTDGSIQNQAFDLVVLSVGQRPSAGSQQASDLTNLPLNQWGFVETEPFAPACTGQNGILAGGSFSGLKDISESVMHASAAALEASRVLHAAGGSLALEPLPEPEFKDVAREDPCILAAVCTCGGRLVKTADKDRWARRLEKDPSVEQVVFLEHACTQTGWEEFIATARKTGVNRVLLAADHPYLFAGKLKNMARELLLDPSLLDVVDIRTPGNIQTTSAPDDPGPEPGATGRGSQQLSAIEIALARLRNADPLPVATLENHRQALVVGGGIAGMTAALSIADHGYPVALIEGQDKLGGNLSWLSLALGGHSMAALFEETLQKVENHPLIEVHLGSTVTASFGEAGNFYTTVSDTDGDAQTLQHATIILATGGGEAATGSYGYGDHPAVITQKELELRLGKEEFDTGVRSVVMIQCVDSREEPRNYCSRVCCPTSLKHALKLKEIDPDIAVYILYRDMMTPGFLESYFTEAREKGIFFIQYDPEKKPDPIMPETPQEPLYVAIVDPMLGRLLHIRADLLVLATGIVPQLDSGLADLFEARIDRDGFFQEADAKWRPVDALKEGVFACGITLSPRSIPEAVVSAQAAAQRSLKLLSRKRLPAGKTVSLVRHSICSRCERCIDTCPYGARSLDVNEDKILVNPVMCQGCGDCAAVCPNSAALVQGFADRQVLDMIDAALS